MHAKEVAYFPGKEVEDQRRGRTKGSRISLPFLMEKVAVLSYFCFVPVDFACVIWHESRYRFPFHFGKHE